MATFAEFRQTFSREKKVRGTQFERVCKWILEDDRTSTPRMGNVWLWDDWPDRWGPDCGIDLVAQDADGKTWAIQAKCYDEDYYVTKGDVDAAVRLEGDATVGVSNHDRHGHQPG